MTVTTSSQSEGQFGGRAYALAILTLVYTFNHIDRQILLILIEPIKAELQISDSAIGLLSGFAFAAFYATFGIPIAMWADRGNRRNILAFALAVWSGMTALSGLAQNFWQLLIARMGVGVGEAGGTPPATSMISDIYAPKERAFALGIYTSGIGLGILAGFCDRRICLSGFWLARGILCRRRARNFTRAAGAGFSARTQTRRR